MLMKDLIKCYSETHEHVYEERGISSIMHDLLRAKYDKVYFYMFNEGFDLKDLINCYRETYQHVYEERGIQ